MPWKRDPPEDLPVLQSSGFTRREFLVVSGVAVSGCSGVAGIGAEYEQSDLELTVGLECVAAESDDVIATLSWEWDGGNGGSKPDDALVIYWPDETWELLTADYSTTETVRFDGKGVVDGVEGVRFRHDDAAAEGGATYAASCELSPKGDFSEDVRNVFGQFAHVRTESDEDSAGTRDDDWFGDVDEAWTAGRETDQSASSCGGGGS